MYEWATIADFEGKTVVSISASFPDYKPVKTGAEEIYFKFSDNTVYKMYHSQDCCETVYLEDIIGCPLTDFVGQTILAAYETGEEGEEGSGHQTWTFYSLLAFKPFVTLRWYGTSNGYYSEGVTIEKIL